MSYHINSIGKPLTLAFYALLAATGCSGGNANIKTNIRADEPIPVSRGVTLEDNQLLSTLAQNSPMPPKPDSYENAMAPLVRKIRPSSTPEDIDSLDGALNETNPTALDQMITLYTDGALPDKVYVRDSEAVPASETIEKLTENDVLKYGNMSFDLKKRDGGYVIFLKDGRHFISPKKSGGLFTPMTEKNRESLADLINDASFDYSISFTLKQNGNPIADGVFYDVEDGYTIRPDLVLNNNSYTWTAGNVTNEKDSGKILYVRTDKAQARHLGAVASIAASSAFGGLPGALIAGYHAYLVDKNFKGVVSLGEPRYKNPSERFDSNNLIMKTNAKDEAHTQIVTPFYYNGNLAALTVVSLGKPEYDVVATPAGITVAEDHKMLWAILSNLLTAGSIIAVDQLSDNGGSTGTGADHGKGTGGDETNNNVPPPPSHIKGGTPTGGELPTNTGN